MDARRLLAGRRLFRKLRRSRGFPSRAIVEMTTRCNCRCANCRAAMEEVSGLSDDGRDMPLDTFKTVLGKIPFIDRFLFAGLGEPFLHPHLLEIVTELNRRGKVTIVETNGTLLTEEVCSEVVRSGLRKLCFSVDSAKPESFEKLREGSHLQQVVENIRAMVRVKQEMKSKTPRLMFIAVVSRDNQDELKGIITLADSLAIPIVAVKNLFAPIAQLEEKRLPAARSRALLNELKRYSRKLPVDVRGHFVFKGGCDNHRRDIFISVNGHVSPCYFIYYPKGVRFGNLVEEDFRSIWNGPEYKRLRSIKTIGKNTETPEYCKACQVQEDL